MNSNNNASSASVTSAIADMVEIIPISHATMVLKWPQVTFYTDPVGGKEAFMNQAAPNIILLTDIHSDHLSLETLAAISMPTTVIIAPKEVYEALTPTLQSQTTIMDNTETIVKKGVLIEAVAMYNIPEKSDAFHTKGRGNGYILEYNEQRIYISGDTSNTAEIRALKRIDIAFVCMNVPYTMNATEAATAVLAFAPKKVYPYHYRQPDGFADVALFKKLVHASNPNIDVVQLDWYK